MTLNGVTNDDRTTWELQASEERYRQLIQYLPTALWQVDSRRAGEAFDQLKANGVRDIAAHLERNPDLVEHAKDVVRVTDVNRDAVSLFRAGNPADLIKPVRYIFAAAPGLAERVMVAHFEGRRNLIEETRIRAFDGSIIDVLFTVTYPVPPEQLDNTFITMQDISERLNAEQQLRKLQADFSHAGRIATLGELATSIAHEINQPLAAIVTNGETSLRWLARADQNTEKITQLTSRIVSNARRASDIIHRIRGMAAKHEPEKRLIDLNEVVEEALLFIRHDIDSKSIVLSANFGSELPKVMGDRIQLQQVIINLLVNSVQAIVQSGQPTRRIDAQTSIDDEGSVVFSVLDNGPGVPAEDLEHIFDSFFSTKDTGIGIGLAICQSIITAHGGQYHGFEPSERWRAFPLHASGVDGCQPRFPLGGVIHKSMIREPGTSRFILSQGTARLYPLNQRDRTGCTIPLRASSNHHHTKKQAACLSGHVQAGRESGAEASPSGATSMSKPTADPVEALPVAPRTREADVPTADRHAADVEMARVLHTAPLHMALDPSGAGIAHWKHEPLHDVVEPMSHHVIMAYNGAVQRMERRSGSSVARGTFRRGRRDHHSRRIKLPMGHSETCRRRSALSSSRIAEARCRRSRQRIDRSPRANGASRSHHIPIAPERGRRAGGQWGPGYAVQASVDGPPGHAPPGCTHRLADHIPAGRGRAFAEGPAPCHRTIAFGQRGGRLPRCPGFRCRPVALPFLPRLQGEHRAFPSRLAAAIPARAGHEHAARHRRNDRFGRSGARLCLADGLRRGIQAINRRNAERLATARALAETSDRSRSAFRTRG